MPELPDWLSSPGEMAAIGLLVIVTFAVPKFMADLLVPMVSAVIIGSVLGRLGDRAARIGVPPIIAGLALVMLSGLVVFACVDALYDPLSALVAQAPTMLETVSRSAAPLLEPITSLKRSVLHLSEGTAQAPVVVSSETAWLAAFFTGLTPALGEFFVFFATLAFFVAGRASLRQRVIMAWEGRKRRLAAIRVINAIEAALALYFGTTAMIYAGVGVLTGLIAFAAGLPNPHLWGALTFAASFVPYFGAGLVTLALAAGGLVTHNQPGWALLPAGAFLLVHLISENALMPAFLGRRLEINPFVVFIAIVFWNWMWGPFGAVLAVPILLIVDTIADELRWFPPDLPD
jgi:predicted PurR-regulated permease PerM